LIRKFPQWLVVGALVLATGVIVPLLRAKHVFAPRTPLALGSSAARPSLRRRVGGRRPVRPSQAVAPREGLVAGQRGAAPSDATTSEAAAPSLREGGEFAKGGGDLPLPRGRRVSLGAAGAEPGGPASSFQPAPPGADSTDFPGDCVLTQPLDLRTRPAWRVAASAPPPPGYLPREAADVPAPPPRLLTC
jgi:hypothetical protein